MRIGKQITDVERVFWPWIGRYMQRSLSPLHKSFGVLTAKCWSPRWVRGGNRQRKRQRTFPSSVPLRWGYIKEDCAEILAQKAHSESITSFPSLLPDIPLVFAPSLVTLDGFYLQNVSQCPPNKSSKAAIAWSNFKPLKSEEYIKGAWKNRASGMHTESTFSLQGRNKSSADTFLDPRSGSAWS